MIKRSCTNCRFFHESTCAVNPKLHKELRKGNLTVKNNCLDFQDEIKLIRNWRNFYLFLRLRLVFALISGGVFWIIFKIIEMFMEPTLSRTLFLLILGNSILIASILLILFIAVDEAINRWGSKGLKKKA
jgi:hypothetical protein